MPTQEKIFARHLRQRRFDLDLRQKVVAARAGVPVALLCKLERGEYATVRPEFIVALAEALSTTTDYLLGHTAAQ